MVDEIPLTREQLYEEVWKEPMTRVSARLGLSDVGLAKICRQADIPVPPRGYWAKKQIGKSVLKLRLPKLDEPIEFVFRPSDRKETPKPPEPEYDADVRDIIELARALPKIVPRAELTDLHPLVERTRVSLSHCKSTKLTRFEPTACFIPTDGRRQRQSWRFFPPPARR